MKSLEMATDVQQALLTSVIILYTIASSYQIITCIITHG